MERIHTLRTIADQVGRDKRTAQNWYTQAKSQHGELGEIIDGTRCFDDSEREILLSYAGADRPAAPSTVHQVEVEPGGGLTTIQPSLPTQFDLSRIRCGGDVATIDDPLAVATQFLQVADQLKAAMGQDLALREAKIQQTRQAREAIAAKAAELQLEQRLYQLQAGNADQTLEQETDQLTAALQTLQSVGKADVSA